MAIAQRDRAERLREMAMYYLRAGLGHMHVAPNESRVERHNHNDKKMPGQ